MSLLDTASGRLIDLLLLDGGGNRTEGRVHEGLVDETHMYFLGVSDQICAVCQESTTNSMLLARGGMPKYVTLDETVCYLQVVLVIK